MPCRKLIPDSMNSLCWPTGQPNTKVMPDDHSELVPLLPIPNRTVKRLSADDSAGSRVKVGHRQALTAPQKPQQKCWGFCFGEYEDRERGAEAGHERSAQQPAETPGFDRACRKLS
jgi:hypothetical protein